LVSDIDRIEDVQQFKMLKIEISWFQLLIDIVLDIELSEDVQHFPVVKTPMSFFGVFHPMIPTIYQPGACCGHPTDDAAIFGRFALNLEGSWETVLGHVS